MATPNAYLLACFLFSYFTVSISSHWNFKCITSEVLRQPLCDVETHTCKLVDVSSIAHEVDYVLQRPPFSLYNVTWMLKTYPYGQTVFKSTELIDVLIQRFHHQDREYEIFFEIYCKELFGKKINSATSKFCCTKLLCKLEEFQNIKECPEESKGLPYDASNLACVLWRQKKTNLFTDSKFIGAIVGAISGAATTVGGAMAAIPAVGFTSSGIAAGSMAAGIQSMIGNVAAGSLFASCQSAGVLGLATGTKVALGTVGVIAGGVTGVVIVPVVGAGVYKVATSETAKSAAESIATSVGELAATVEFRLSELMQTKPSSIK